MCGCFISGASLYIFSSISPQLCIVPSYSLIFNTVYSILNKAYSLNFDNDLLYLTRIINVESTYEAMLDAFSLGSSSL